MFGAYLIKHLMIGRIYNFMYYRTYLMISKTNKLSPVSSSARLLAIGFSINILALFFFFENQLPKTKKSFYFFVGVGIVGSFYIIYYFSDRNTYYIINEYLKIKVNKFWSFLADYYFDISVLLLSISTGVELYSILYILGILIFIRLILYFADL